MPIKPNEARLEEISETFAPGVPETPAKSAYERLMKLVKNFEAGLDSEHEIGFIATSSNGPCRVQQISYWSPDFLLFSCASGDGQNITLVQHHSQLNCSLLALPKFDRHAPARRIGFAAPDTPREGMEE